MLRTRHALGIAAAAALIGVVVLANWLSSRYGTVPVWWGFTASAGTYAAGAALGLRDAVQETFGRVGSLAVIAVAALLSYLAADAHVATASACAFAVAELVDLAVYSAVRPLSWALAVLVSNVVAAPVDSYVFLHVADFPADAHAIAGQMIGKLLWATLVPLALILTVRALIARRQR